VDVRLALEIFIGAKANSSKLDPEAIHNAEHYIDRLAVVLTATKCVSSRSHSYSSTERNVHHAESAVLRLFDGDSITQ
jgi:hypothetical protein